MCTASPSRQRIGDIMFITSSGKPLVFSRTQWAQHFNLKSFGIRTNLAMESENRCNRHREERAAYSNKLIPAILRLLRIDLHYTEYLWFRFLG